MAIVDDEDLPGLLHLALRANPSLAMLREREDLFERLLDTYADDSIGWTECCAVFKQFRLVRDITRVIKTEVHKRKKIRKIGSGPVTSERLVNTAWPDALVFREAEKIGELPPEFTVPENYVIHPHATGEVAIFRVEQRQLSDGTTFNKMFEVSMDPVFITKRVGHIQDNHVFLEVNYRVGQGWRRGFFGREEILDTRQLIKTSSEGMPVGSGNALELCDWLRHFETANYDTLPIGYASSAMGWQGDISNPTKHGFLCGNRQIGGNGKAIQLEGSPGDMADARELKETGTFEAWKEAVQKMIHFPAVRLAIYAALAPPLLAPLDGPNAIVEWSGRTSTGKSTVLQIAQSCWRNAALVLATWNTTAINVEAAAQFTSDLPLIIDDTAAAGDSRSLPIGKIIYQIISGRARGRANREGKQRERPTWRTVLLSSGETPLSDIAKQEGAAARVLTFWSSPLGETTPETATLVRDTMHALAANSGHAGPRLVNYLCNHREDWPYLRELYSACTHRVRQKICTPAASRLAEVVGLLEVAAYVAHKAGILETNGMITDDPAVADLLRRAMTHASSSSDRAYDAWEYALSEADSRPRSWVTWGSYPPEDDRDPNTGWLGWRNDDEGFIAWHPPKLRKVLTEGGFTPESIFRAWKDVGLLVKPERDRHTTSCRPVPSERAKKRLIVMKTTYPGHESGPDEDLLE
jgi:putative DNA primase/helicase